MCDFDGGIGGDLGLIAIAIGISDVATARVSDDMCDFGRNSAHIAIAIGIFDVADTLVPDAICDFSRNLTL